MLSPEGWRRTRFSSPVLFSQEAGIGKRREAHASVNEVSGGHGLAVWVAVTKTAMITCLRWNPNE
jgi:hypothetical protein